jgi:hypothetical protein
MLWQIITLHTDEAQKDHKSLTFYQKDFFSGVYL